MSIDRLALGTAQFGLDYGINNQRGQIDKDEAFAILNMAQGAGVNTIDTASAYGNSEDVLGAFTTRFPGGFKFISKSSGNSLVSTQLEETLSRLKIARIYGYLLHQFDAYKRNPVIFDQLVGLRDQGKVKKVGFSLYYPAEIEFILKEKLPVDIIQLPYSIFDQRFSKYLIQLKERNIEVHARSVFLQGLVFKQPDSLDSFFAPIKDRLISLRDIAKETKMPLHRLCVSFALANKNLDKVIVGVDNRNHFKEIIQDLDQSLSSELYNSLVDMAVDDEQIVVPSNWGKVRA